MTGAEFIVEVCVGTCQSGLCMSLHTCVCMYVRVHVSMPTCAYAPVRAYVLSEKQTQTHAPAHTQLVHSRAVLGVVMIPVMTIHETNNRFCTYTCIYTLSSVFLWTLRRV